MFPVECLGSRACAHGRQVCSECSRERSTLASETGLETRTSQLERKSTDSCEVGMKRWHANGVVGVLIELTQMVH